MQGSDGIVHSDADEDDTRDVRDRGYPPSRRRRGLGFFPDAVTIRSGPSSSRPVPEYEDYNEDQIDFGSVPIAAGPSRLRGVNTAQANASSSAHAHSRPEPAPYLPQGRESWSMWKAWHTNPTGHGRGGRTGPPAFVLATSTYDELGRSVDDGFDVQVDHRHEDHVEEAAAADKKEEKMAGGDVAEWYRALSRGASPKPPDAVDVPTRPHLISSQTHPQTTPTLTTTSTPTTTATYSPSSTPSPAPGPATVARPTPVRSHQRDWFSRRALHTASRDSSTLPAPPCRPPSSIGALLGTAPAASRSAPTPRTRYALGPDNRGYAMLDKLGWEGGGLGRPEGWDEAEWMERRERQRQRQSQREKETRGGSAGAGEQVDGVVDLTAETDDDSDRDGDGLADDDDDGADVVGGPVVPTGPGRIVPVATALKLDRLGLGRARGVEKKVTHSASEIAAAQRRARGVRSAKAAADAESKMGKKAKVKWAVRERREREERKRLAGLLNA